MKPRIRTDGEKRPRRNGTMGLARQRWYAAHRAKRFARRMGMIVTN